MSFSPEIGKLPELFWQFQKSGLVGELLKTFILGQTNRDLVADSRRFLTEFSKEKLVTVTNTEDLPKDGGCLIVVNHPNVEVLIPAFLKLISELSDKCGRTDVHILAGSEIPLFGRIERYPLPGSASFLRRFHRIYPENILPVPTASVRKDYWQGRIAACRHILESLKNGEIVALAPEGHVERNNIISPIETYNHGSGALAIRSKNEGVFQIVPVAILEKSQKGINVIIGKPFVTESSEKKEASEEIMKHIAELLPNYLRGPFQTSSD